jgi:hypothetical protein
MLEKRRPGEGAETVASQDPRDMVKAGLLEFQSQAFICATAGIAPDNGAIPCSEYGIGSETTSEEWAADNESD